MNKKILLVEDDLILGETMVDILENESYNIIWARDGQDALDIIYNNNFDIYLLDFNIPLISGFELLKELRDSGDITPAIFITANIDIKVMKKGFEIGGDDYIKKPFDIDELLIRIEAALKKSFKNYDDIVKYDKLSYNTKQQLLSKNNEPIHLSPTEIILFEYFLKNFDRIISKDELINHTHDGYDSGSDAVLRVQISKLKKIGLRIVNIRGVGYRCEKV